MKKTTYILIIFFSVLFVFAFLSPLIFMTERSDDPNGGTYNIEYFDMVPKGNPQQYVMTPFHTIAEVDIDMNTNVSLDSNFPLTLNVVESDSVTSPKIDLDACWNGNVKPIVENDTLYFTIDMKALVPKAIENYGIVMAPLESKEMATVTVPRGMLKQILANTNFLNLEDFKGAELFISSQGTYINAVNSNFSFFTIENTSPSYNYY